MSERRKQMKVHLNRKNGSSKQSYWHHLVLPSGLVLSRVRWQFQTTIPDFSLSVHTVYWPMLIPSMYNTGLLAAVWFSFGCQSWVPVIIYVTQIGMSNNLWILFPCYEGKTNVCARYPIKIVCWCYLLKRKVHYCILLKNYLIDQICELDWKYEHFESVKV